MLKRSSKPVSRVTGLTECQTEVIAQSIYFQLVHSLPAGMSYRYLDMANPFESYHQELFNRESITTLIAARVLIEQRGMEYNQVKIS